MNQRQREKAERLMLKQTLDSNPKLKQVIDAMIDNPNPEIKDAVAPVIEQKLHDAQMRGILIGWSTFAKHAITHIKKMKTVDEIKAYFQAEADKMDEKLGIKKEK